MLTSYNGTALSFEYNADGIRTEKTVSGEYTYTYRLDGDKVVEMIKSGVGDVMRGNLR